MSATVAPTYQFDLVTLAGAIQHNAKLVVTGLSTGGNNTVPHGLTDGKGNAVTPLQVDLEPTSSNTFWEYQAADSTNIYVGVGAGTGTTTVIYVTY